MQKTNWTGRIYIGTNYGECEYLAAPSWDCGWYWGFGYLQGKHIHHHLDTLGTKNMYDNLKEYYGDTLAIPEDKIWEFCELMSTAYTLKETAEVLGRGGAHYTTNPLAELIIDKEYTVKINTVLLPAIFNRVHALLKIT